MNRLSKIVHKIANYVPGQSKGLTEDEFKVLDQATGVELADIAYNNRINFTRFLKNADKMIDEYNENLVWTQIKEVKALKRCLLNPGSFTTQKPAVIAEKQVPVQNDNVVPQMELPPNSPENIGNGMEQVPVIENELAQTVPNVPTFVSSLLADNSGLSKSTSMHRNIINRTGNIVLQQKNFVPNSDDLLENDEMPILNELEMAQMGVFDGLAGKKISKVLHQSLQRDESNRLPSLSINADIDARHVQPLELDVNPLSVDNMDNLLITPNADHYDFPDLSPLPLNDQQEQLPPIDDQQQNQIIIEQINPGNIPIPNPTVEQTQNEIENVPNDRDSMAERADSFRNAVAAFEGFLGKARRVAKRGRRQKQPEREEDLLTMLKLRKEVPFKTRKRKQIRPIKLIKLPIVDLDFFNDIGIFIANDLPFDDEQPDAEVQQRRESDFNLEFDPVTTHHRVATSTPMNTAQKNKRLNSSPEQLDQQPKRTRPETLDDIRNYLLDLPDPPQSMAPIPELPQELTDIDVPQPPISIQQPQKQISLSIPQPEPSDLILPIQQESIQPPTDLELPQQENIENIELFIPPAPIQRESLPAVSELPELEIDLPLPIAESSREQSIPQKRRQSRLDILQNLHITPESIDYDRLRRSSKLRKTPIDSSLQILPEEIFQNACENISEREAAKIRSSIGNIIKEPSLNIPPMRSKVVQAPKPTKEKFEGFPRVMMKGEKYVELKSNDGTKKMHYTEHQLSCMTLYYKIRFLMHEIKGTEPWRMTIKELFSKLKDLKDSKLVTYQQIMHMTQIKLFTAKWSDDDELLEIEIPIDRIEETSDKENLPSARRVATRQVVHTRSLQA